MEFSFDLVSHTINSATTGGNFSEAVGFTSDSRYLLFRSFSAAIAPTDANNTTDYFIYDTQDGSVGLVTHTSGSLTTTANAAIESNPQFLGDGRFLLFRSGATNMVGNDANGIIDFFVYDIQDGSLDLVTHTAGSLTTSINGGAGLGGGIGTSHTAYQSFSSNGRYILLVSSSTNVAATDANGKDDLFVYDTQDGSIDLVSHAAGSTTTTVDQFVSLSFLAPDGQHVIFQTREATSPNPTAVVLYDVETKSLQTLSGNASNPIAFSPDGRYALYSQQDVPTDPNGPSLFVYDTQDGSTELVNHTSGSLTTPGNNFTQTPGVVGNFLAFSPDSRYVAFTSSATDIAGTDTNTTTDLFLYDTT